MILLPSSENRLWPWTGTPERRAEGLFEKEYPAVHAHFKPMEAKLRKRTDQGQYWWELRSCAYYDAFEQPKIMYQEIQFYPSYVLDREGRFCNNKVFLLPTEDLYLLAVLNSPLMWWHNWRFLPHMKDDALSPVAFRMEEIPIAMAPKSVRAHVAGAVDELVRLTCQLRDTRQRVLEWLRIEYSVDVPGQKLEAFAELEQDGFIAEVKRRRPRKAPGLAPRDLSRLTEVYEIGRASC